MRRLLHITIVLFLWAFTLTASVAQDADDDKGFLTRTLQNVLSGAGRTVSIDGFEGALSSRASFDRMTIADDEGVWLTLEDVLLDWNRSALLRGRLEVQSLTAARLDIPRLPQGNTDTELPEAEATPFSLPDLPVSVDIADFAVETINLGAPVLGEDTQLRVTANAGLDDAGARIDLQAERTDAKRGVFTVKTDLKREENVLDLLIRLSEGEEGIVARLLSIPDQPTLDLMIEGAGPLDDLVTDLALSTAGQERLAGQVTLGVQPSRRNAAQPDRRVQANIGGDVTALLAPRFQEFFGEDVRLRIDALLESSGAVEVSTFDLNARAAQIAGNLTLNADGWPSLIDITGRVANPDGTPVLLPLGGEAKTVEGMDLRVAYDAENGDALDANFDITALSMPGVAIASTRLGLDGTLSSSTGAQGAFEGEIRFDAQGLALTDAAVSEALGDSIAGRARIGYVEGRPVRISGLDLSGADYALTGNAVIDGVEASLRTELDARLEASDLSRFSALAGRELDGSTALELQGTVTPLDGAFDLVANGNTDDLKLGIAQADAVLAGRTTVSMQALRDETGTFLRDLVLQNEALNLTGRAALRTDNSDVEADFRLEDIGLVAPQYQGPVTVRATATQDAEGWRVDARTEGPYAAAIQIDGLASGPNALLNFSADIPEVKPFADQIEGPVNASGILRQTPDGWRIDTSAAGPYDIEARVEGLVTPLDITFDLSAPDVNPLVPQVKGPLEAKGRLRQTQNGLEIETQATGPYRVEASVAGQITPKIAVSYDLSLPDVQPLVPQFSGALSAQGTLRQEDAGFFVDTTARGPYGLQAAVEGLATGPDMRLTFDASLPDVGPLAPGINGPLAATGVVRQTEDGIALDTNATGPYRSTASVQGVVTGPQAAVAYDVFLPNLGALVPQINGPLTVKGDARKQGDAWRIDTDADGPSGTQAQIAGTVNPGGTLDLDISGTAPLGLSRPFIAPRSLQGQARFDLSVDGPPALSSVTGTIQTDNASLSAPNLRVALEGIAANIQLARNRADLEISGSAVNGGRLRVGGSVTLTGSLPADIQIGLENLALVDPRLFATTVSGALRLAGPLTGGARISGAVDVGETDISVPSTGLTSIGDIPAIDHIGATRPVMATRRKAGVDAASQAEADAARTGPGFGLDLQVNAPNRIFVRGRGLDAELGGGLRLTGTTNRIISAGRFSLLRGRLDILGKRFDLREGSIQFQGDLVPFIRFVSATDTQTGEVRVIVEGPADAPEVSFESTPEAPQDEVLAQLLFGRNISEISAFQALQLANAVATLAGRGGTGVISNLREGFGLDDLDVTTTDDGATAVRAGKYISENVYSDVTAASDGSADVSLNIDITPNLKGKATLGSDGDTGIGIFFEKDY
ncbi:translocation/assembly module TamB domain-containing protein [Sulfitobacter sp. JB4-11]|uniref:translocation/assembly module TamB domain-containing protein n=1 Tax=Sulfitobacter rhodophyticola TaxID=3238304 RepID=UPI003D81A15B